MCTVALEDLKLGSTMSMNYKKIKKRIFDIIQIGQRDDTLSKVFDIFIVIVILINIAAMFMGTFKEMSRFNMIIDIAESITIGIFCIEYILRIWTSEFLYPKVSKAKSVVKFLLSFDGIVDLLTILPFFFLSGFIAFRMLRVVRIFHLFRINAYYDSFNVITSVLYEKRNQIISSVFIIVILMLCSSLCMYSAEQYVQPDVFDNAFSGIWWSISTILTIGYGDIYPVTILGKIMGALIGVLGVGAVAIPTGIISAGFVEQYTNFQKYNSAKVQRITTTLTIDSNSPLIGQTPKSFEAEKEKADVIVIIRDGIVMIPTDDTKFKENDVIVYQDEI